MKLVTSKKQGGFTLVELVMVIVVIALLSAYVGPKFASIEGQARAATLNKIAGTFAETINVVKAISIVELDGNVPDAQGAINAEGLSLTAVDYDGNNTTDNATTNVLAISVLGEDILTEFHYPKAVSSDIGTLTEASAAAVAASEGTDSSDSILFALEATGVTIFRVEDDETVEATLLDHRQLCAEDTAIDNDGSIGGVHGILIAYESTPAATADQVTIVPCGILASSQTNALVATTTITALACYTRYTDAGTPAGAAVDDVFVEPTVTTVTSGC